MTSDVSVLLVDDDADWVSITARLLEREDSSLRVSTATSALDASRVLETDSIDCVVCDYHMPEMDGLDFLRQVRETRPRLPFVMITGRGSEAVASEAIAAGVTDYFVKDDRRDRSAALATRVRDAVDRDRAGRALARERDLEAALRDQVLTARSREDVEAAACDLAAADHAFAWIGGFDPTGTLTVRARAGEDDGDLDSLVAQSRAVDRTPTAGGEGGDDPTIRALRTSTALVESGTPDGRRPVAAAPIEGRGVPYGVLGVYGERSGPGPDLQAVIDLAETLGVAIAAVERRSALSANRVVEVTLCVDASPHPLVGLASALDRVIDVTGHVSTESGCRYFLELSDVAAATVRESVTARGDLGSVAVLTAEPRLRVQLSAPASFATTVVDHGGQVQSMTAGEGALRATVAFPARVDVPSVLDELTAETVGLSVEAYREREYPWSWRAPAVLPGDLTDRQRESLAAAYHGGYFDRPRHQSAENVADALGIARTTFMHHLRIAERKVFEALLDGESDPR